MMKDVHITTGRAETTFAAEGNIFKISAMRIAPEDTAIGRIFAMKLGKEKALTPHE